MVQLNRGVGGLLQRGLAFLCLALCCLQVATAVQIIDVQVITPGDTAWLHDPIVIRCHFDANINTTCTSASICATLDLGCPLATAVYLPSPLPHVLEFLYYVHYGDQCEHLYFDPNTAIELEPGVSVTDSAGNPVNLTLPNTLDSSNFPKVDTHEPTITAITTTTQPGVYGADRVIRITVTFSAAISIDISGNSMPSIDLNSKGSAVFVGVDSKDPHVLNFKYDVKPGEETLSSYLNVADDAAFDAQGAIIFGSASQLEANLLLPTNQLNVSKIVIRTSGSAFPPLGYAKDKNPRGSAGPTLVTVLPEFHGIYEISEKQQTFKADVSLITVWADPGLAAVNLTEFTDSVFDQIWSPQLVFLNLRDQGKLLLNRVVVNRGLVEHWQRWLITFGFVVDASSFPFDTQVLEMKQQSIKHNKTSLAFQIIQDTANFTKFSTHLTNLDPGFQFLDLVQNVSEVNDALSFNYYKLQTSFRATRQRTLASLNVLFPLSMLMLSAYFTFWMTLKTDSRLTASTAAIVGTMTFTQTVTNILPPVAHATRMSNFILFSYCYTFACLCVQVVLRSIYFYADEMKRDAKKIPAFGKDKNASAAGMSPTLHDLAGLLKPTPDDAPLEYRFAWCIVINPKTFRRVIAQVTYANYIFRYIMLVLLVGIIPIIIFV